MKTLLAVFVMLLNVQSNAQTPEPPCITEEFIKAYALAQNLKTVVLKGEDLYAFNKKVVGDRMQENMDEALVIYYNKNILAFTFKNDCYEDYLRLSADKFDEYLVQVQKEKA